MFLWMKYVEQSQFISILNKQSYFILNLQIYTGLYMYIIINFYSKIAELIRDCKPSQLPAG